MRQTLVLGLVGATATATTLFLTVGPGVGGTDDGIIDGPVIAHRPWDAYPAAQVRGQLTLESGCLTIGGRLVVWDHGATWDAEAQAVVLDGYTYAVGETVEGGGGEYTDLDQLGDFGDVATDALKTCAEATGWGRAVEFYSG